MINLYDYQQKGVDFLLKHQGGMLMDEQGLGKTIQSIEATNNMKCDMVCVICPAIMRGTWRKELEAYSNKKYFAESYEYYGKHYKDFLKIKERIIYIIDEAHYIKSPTSKRTMTVQILLKQPNVVGKILLTGTPVTRDVDDLYTQLNVFLNGEAWWSKNIWQFRKTYMHCVHNYFGDKYTGFKNKEAENNIKTLLRRVGLRRTKSQVLDDLPSITRKKIYIDCNKKIAQESMKLLDYAIAYITQDYSSYDEYKKELEESNIHVSTIRRALGIAKAPQIIEFMKHLTEGGVKKTVLFCVHTELINLLEKSLKDELPDYKISKIMGSTSDKQRQDIITSFQKDNGEKHIIISNVIAGGVGITLTQSNVVVFGEIDWTPANLMQAEARVHRISQKKNVLSYYLIANGSIDDRILDIIKTKTKIIKEIM